MPKKLKERVRIGEDANGKPKYKYVYAQSKQELQRRIADLLYSGEITASAKAPSKITVKKFIEETFMPNYTNHLAPSTKESYEQQISLYILRFLGEMQMDQVEVKTIQNFYDWMASGSQHGFKKNLNKSTIERVSGLTSRIFKIAQEMGIIHETPFKKNLLRIRAEPAKHHKPLPDELIARVRNDIPSLENEDQRLYMGLLAFTGMRPSEVLGMRWENIYLADQYALVDRGVTYPKNNHAHIGSPKTESSERTVLLPNPLVGILQPLAKKEGYVCGGEQPWCYSKSRRVSKGAFKALEINGYSDYDFRSTYATQMKESGMTASNVADLLGHADSRMVEHVYARPRHEGVMKHLGAVEKLLGEAS